MDVNHGGSWPPCLLGYRPITSITMGYRLSLLQLELHLKGRISSVSTYSGWSWEYINGHSRIRLIGGTYHIRPLFKAYVSEYPHKIWPEIWYSTSICWILEFPLIMGFHGNSMENPTPCSTKQHLSMLPNISGWWLTYPSEKSWISSVGMMTFPIYGKKTCSKPATRYDLILF